MRKSKFLALWFAIIVITPCVFAVNDDSTKMESDSPKQEVLVISDSTGDSIDKIEEEQSVNGDADLQQQREPTHNDISDSSVMFIVLFLEIVGFLYIIYRLRGLENSHKNIEHISTEMKNSFSYEMNELQKIEDSLSSFNKKEPCDLEKTHSLIMAIANNVTTMEIAISKMNLDTRDYKRLFTSIDNIKTKLKGNDYEIVDMIGSPYDEGMNVIANFIEDENLEKGKQIIASVRKPQINYKGKMIQAAEITVSQNI